MSRFVFFLGLFVFTFLSCKNPKSNQTVAGKQQDTLVQQTTKQLKSQPLSFTKYADLRSFVRKVKFSPDGQYLVSGNVQLAIFKRTSTGFELVKLFAPHSDRINSIDFSPDGRYMATASDDSTVLIYEFQGGQTRVFKRLTDFTADLLTATFSPDGKLLACATNNDSVFVYDVANGFSLLKKFQVIGVVDVKFTHDGKYLLADAELEYDAGYENQLSVYDVQNGFNLVSSVKLEPIGYKITVSPDDKTVFASGAQFSYVLNFLDGKLSVKEQIPCNGEVPGIFVNNDTVIAGNQVSKTATSLKLVYVSGLAGDYSSYNDLDYSPHNRLVAISYSDGKILLYRLNDELELEKYSVLKDFPVFVKSLDFAGDSLVTGGGDGSSWADIRILDLNQQFSTGKSITDTLYNQFVSLRVSPLAKYIVAGDWRGNFYVFTKTGIGYQLSKMVQIGQGNVFVDLSSDGNYIVAGCDTTLMLFKRQGGQFELIGKRNESAGVHAVRFAPDGKIFAVYLGKDLVKFYNVQDNFNTFKTFTLHISEDLDYTPEDLAFSPDGKQLAVLVGYPIRRVFVYDFGGNFITEIRFKGDISKLSFSPDGQYLAVSMGSLVEIYKQTVTGYEFFKEISVDPYTVENLAFSRNGKYFAIATMDGVVVFK